MTSYTDRFGGSTVQPSDVGFRSITLSASIVTVWPPYATADNECARIMKVSASAGALTITLPDATLTSLGTDVFFDNSGANTFTVLDSAGGSIATLTAGQVKYLYLSDNSTAAGTWRVTLFGVGASTLDASQLAGYGVKALNNTLNAAPVLVDIASDTTVTSADRAKILVWSGGSGTITLPTTVSSTSDFNIEVRNQGTGTVTIQPVGGVLIDGSPNITLTVNESCFIHMGTSDWYTVGRGRNTAFNFTQLNKSVTGGTTDLTLTEASNVVQTYTGTLTSNQTIRLPAVVQVYYISNATTGPYTLTFTCVTGGSASVSVTQGQAAVLFCDSLTVINANTSLSGGITSLVFAAASAASPSVAIASSDAGLYSPSANQVGIAINGVAAGLWTASGYKTVGSAAKSVSAVSSGAGSALETDRPAGYVGSVNFRTAGVDRWKWIIDSVAEAGANAGSNLNLSSYDDAGSLLGTVMTINRATQVVTFTQPLSGAVSLSGTNTWTGAQTFTNSLLKLLGSSTGVTVFASANSSGTDYTITFPASTGTVLTTAAAVTPAQGGTGVANGANNTITFTGNYTFGATLTGNTAVTFPTSGTLATTSQVPTAANPTGTISGAAVNGVATTFMRSDAAPALSATVNPVGLQTCWIPAGAMVARTTNGAASGTAEMSTNKNMFKTLDFDTATSEYAQFAIQMPKSWNEGTVTAAFCWSHASTTTNFGVTFALQAVAISNDDAGDVAFGTAQTAADTGGTTNDIYVSPTTSAITIAGTPAANDYVMFQVYRAVSDGGDTMAIDARLHGIQLFYSTDAATDA